MQDIRTKYVTIGTGTNINGPSFLRGHESCPITIGNNCWIGDNVCIMSGVTIGDGAVLGAGSVATKDIPPFAMAYGVPATVAGYRFKRHIIQALLEIAWWDWDESTIAANSAFFNLDLTEHPEADLRSLIVTG